MKLADKTVVTEALRANGHRQYRGEFTDNRGNVCAMGCVYEAYGVSLEPYNSRDGIAMRRMIDFPYDLGNKIIIMNDREGLSFAEIADWIEANVPVDDDRTGRDRALRQHGACARRCVSRLRIKLPKDRAKAEAIRLWAAEKGINLIQLRGSGDGTYPWECKNGHLVRSALDEDDKGSRYDHPYRRCRWCRQEQHRRRYAERKLSVQRTHAG